MVLGRAARTRPLKKKSEARRARSETLHHDGHGDSWGGDQLGKHEGNAADGKGASDSCKHAQCTLAVAKDRH